MHMNQQKENWKMERKCAGNREKKNENETNKE